ncbi:MAG: hypothetical protein KKD39_00310 [Candidatus Altiarchaeota archaeon]|nr:hypothetical protein [Candidatus Altiarchaeota archaeon]
MRGKLAELGDGLKSIMGAGGKTVDVGDTFVVKNDRGRIVVEGEGVVKLFKDQLQQGEKQE